MIEALNEINVRSFSLVCDGPAVHRKMMNLLGGDVENLTGTFPNPCEPSLPVYGLLDVVHMLKLIRNSFAGYETLIDSDGKLIQWKYIESLHRVQEQEGFRLGTKLKKIHMKWRQLKMKVLKYIFWPQRLINLEIPVLVRSLQSSNI